jgi:hypothetical protein
MFGFRASFVVLSVALGALSACVQKELATAPSDLATGIVIHEDPNYRGKSAHITSDARDLQYYFGPCFEVSNSADGVNWDDCISSVRVAPGWRAQLFEDEDFEGRMLTVTSDMRDLRSVPGPCGDDFNDCVSSIRVFMQ